MLENTYSVSVGGNVSYMSVRPIWLEMEFNSCNSLLISCHDNLCVTESGG